MNTSSELDRIVADWLDARAADPPPGGLGSALARAGQTTQRRHWWLRPWHDHGRAGTAGAGRDGRDGRTGDRGTRLLFSAAAVVMAIAVLALVTAIRTRPSDPVTPALIGTTHYVAAEGGDFTTIGAAVDAAQDGDTVLVAPGTYREALVIDKDITLAGQEVPRRAVLLLVPEDAPDPVIPLVPFDPRADPFRLPEHVPVGIQVVDSDANVRNIDVMGTGDSIALLVHGGAPTLEKLSLKHQGASLLAIDIAGALFIEGGSAATVTDIDTWYRVRIADGASPTITESDFSLTRLVIQDGSVPVLSQDTFSGDCSCADIVVTGGSSPTFRDNIFTYAGLDLVGHEGDGTSAVVDGNRFSSHELDALSVTSTASAEVTGNAFLGNRWGVRVEAATAEVRDNEFLTNGTGVLLSAADVTLADNSIRGGQVGVAITSGSSPLISGNVIEDASARGIFAAGGTSPTIEGNTVCGSAANLVLDPEANATVGDNDICPDGVVAE